ncbi:hypothetical protein ANO14919_029730 [Xylariales sp. No.14919]|nr:hypothetical protein ANO14919_029730 [Xylariales sp. No.14919]
MHQRYIVDENGRELGKFCDEYEATAAEGSPEFSDLAMIATVPSASQAYPEGGNKKAVLLLEISKDKDGISSRNGVAYVLEECWLQAARRSELVILN